ncbi:class I SAM-dependent methyltransferase [Fusibacter sp. JL298sf-3]
MTLDELYKKIFYGDTLIGAVLSGVVKKSEKTYQKLTIKPVLIKSERVYQLTYHYDKKVLHDNLTAEVAMAEVSTQMGTYFKQAVFFTASADYQVLVSKKGKVKIIEQPPSKQASTLAHNRKKQYVIEEGQVCDFMVHLGIMSEDGRVHPKSYDKFRQLNKYLEFVKDSLGAFDKAAPLTIVDFGCGKAYLTFALYYYLVKQCGYRATIIGLDLKEDVIAFCNETAKALKYEGLQFEVGDIAKYRANGPIDMVVSLHACDTATDAALIKAVGWQAKVIFAVPCCQHELFSTIKHDALAPMLEYGVQRDKFTALLTDTLRASALKAVGYHVQVLEFIDMVHTPKNVLIRAYLKGTKPQRDVEALAAYNKLKSEFSVVSSIDPLVDMTEVE